MSKWFYRFLQAFLSFAAIAGLSALYNYFRYFVNIAGDATYFLSAMLLINFLFGALLGLEHLLRERVKRGKWVFDLPRGVLLVLPALLLSIYYFVYYSRIPFPGTIMHGMPPLFADSTNFVMLCQIFFGYTLLTNFKKRPVAENTND